MNRILLLEDDLSLIDGLSFALKKQSFDVLAVRTLTDAKAAWMNNEFDLLILDISLPDGSGFDFCAFVRRTSDVPILFLTAKDEETDIVHGLDIGGDDYVTKPFKLSILISRVNALLRRKGAAGEKNSIVSNGIRIELSQCRAYKNGQSLELTAAEFKLLCLLMQNQNTVLTKAQIYERLWDCNGCFVEDNTLSVYIRRLRLKVEDDPERPERIVTVRGIGYKWSVQT